MIKIYLDFDGTVVEHLYPKIGQPNPMAIEVINKLMKSTDVVVILNTYRANLSALLTVEALNYINQQLDIPITRFTSSKIDPDMWDWNLIINKNIMFIDDIAHKMPLIPGINGTLEMVNWKELDKQFKEHKIYE